MFAIIAAVLFVIAGVIIFGALSGVNALGLIAFGLAALAIHLLSPWYPWRGQPRQP
jgi:hypothetical protein